MTNILIAVVVLLIVGLAAAYIVRSKRRGVRCIGCPSGGCCFGQRRNQTEEGCRCCHRMEK